MRDRGRARQVARLFSDGVSRESICEATGLTNGTVSAYVSYARREGLLEPVRGHVTLTARLRHDHAEALRREAERRGCEVNELTASKQASKPKHSPLPSPPPAD